MRHTAKHTIEKQQGVQECCSSVAMRDEHLPWPGSLSARKPLSHTKAARAFACALFIA